MSKIFSIFPPGLNNIKSIEGYSLYEIGQAIRGSENLKEVTNKLRSITDKNSQDIFKRNHIPYFTPGGIFSIRMDSRLIKASHVGCIDLDNVQDTAALKSMLVTQCNWILILFISPRGKGLKVLFRCNPNFDYKENYHAFSNYLIDKFQVDKDSIDYSCASISKACLFSYDEDAFMQWNINPGSVVEDHPFIEDQYFNLSKNNSTPINNSTEDLEVPNLFETNDFQYHDIKLNQEKINIADNFKQLCKLTARSHGDLKEGNRHNYFFNLAVLCNRLGMKETFAVQYCLKFFSNHPSLTNKENPFSEENDLKKPFSNVYSKFENDFSTWDWASDDWETPLIPEIVYSKLPLFIKKMTDLFIEREKDNFFIGLTTFLSTLFPRIRGVYGRRLYRMNLFSFISAPPASGKGVLNWIRIIGEKIHESFLDKYKEELKIYTEASEEDKKEMITPLMQKVFIPADNTYPMIIKSVDANKCFGMIMDSEADTLTVANKSEHGNFSVVFRKGFEHETIEYERKTTKEYYVINQPALSILISGTHKQINRLMTDVENGFTSRFIFYKYSRKSEWKDMFKEGEDYEHIFKSAAIELNDLVQPYLNDYIANPDSEIRFDLTGQQKINLNAWFADKLRSLNHLYGNDIDGSVIRLGVIHFRICMVLTAVRQFQTSQKNFENLTCSDEDFETAQTIIDTLLHHTVNVFQQLQQKSTFKNFRQKRDVYFDKLPAAFDWQKAKEIATYLGINHKTAENYLRKAVADGVIQKSAHNNYSKNI